MALVDDLHERAAAASNVFSAAPMLNDAVESIGTVAGEPLGPHLEAIREAFLLHRGARRALVPADDDSALLLGDFLYADGLVGICSDGDIDDVRALADLIAAAASEPRDATTEERWEATARYLGRERHS